MCVPPPEHTPIFVSHIYDVRYYSKKRLAFGYVLKCPLQAVFLFFPCFYLYHIRKLEASHILGIEGHS